MFSAGCIVDRIGTCPAFAKFRASADNPLVALERRYLTRNYGRTSLSAVARMDLK